jgi:NitT/TauT family transport system ATP-binding protein
MNNVPFAAHIRRVLDERSNHTAPRRRFIDELEDKMSEDAADETLRAMISWARFAELFSYDDESETFSLENPT